MQFPHQQAMSTRAAAMTAESDRRRLFPVAGKEVGFEPRIVGAGQAEPDTGGHRSVSRLSQSWM